MADVAFPITALPGNSNHYRPGDSPGAGVKAGSIYMDGGAGWGNSEYDGRVYVGAEDGYLNLPPGAPPRFPENGDVWITSDGLYARISNQTVGPFGTGNVNGAPVITDDTPPVTTQDGALWWCSSEG